MNIWLVSIFENTPLDDNQNTRYNCLVNEAIKRGHNVTFWASTFRHNVKQQRYEKTRFIDINEYLSVKFVKSKSYKKNISFKRLGSHRGFSKALIRKFETVDTKPDLIVNAFPPISVAYEVSKWAVRNDIPYILDVIDPWPDVFKSHIHGIPDGIKNLLLKPLQNKVKNSVENANAVIGISNQYIKWAKSYSELDKISNCYYPAVQFDLMQGDLEKFSSERSGLKKDIFEVIYAGSLGYSYDLTTILNAAKILEKKYTDKIHFTIAGDGPQKKKVETYQAAHKNLSYVGRVPKEELMSYYYNADIGMTQHIKGATQSVTYKLFDLLACGLPILNSLESEMKSIIIDNEVGLHNNPGDAEQLADNIIYLYNNSKVLGQMKTNAIDLTRQLGDSKKVYSEALTFFESFHIGKNDAKKSEASIYS